MRIETPPAFDRAVLAVVIVASGFFLALWHRTHDAIAGLCALYEFFAALWMCHRLDNKKAPD